MRRVPCTRNDLSGPERQFVFTLTMIFGSGISGVLDAVGVNGKVGVIVAGKVSVTVGGMGVKVGVRVIVADGVNVGETYFSVNPTMTVCATAVLKVSSSIGSSGIPHAKTKSNEIIAII